ncbi:sugar transferase [Chitinophaga arvensicola]|uniref:Sugar transferase involved in LPS biosynthesis (Colanic, teichoic acid) n=1 Tax=Chitinophaga arvensicola TaxID=29529 RepID=A0A1I0S8N1_9BACT|nr:sugar transferase [Chitinophaga arvensicola]SEW52471.1 Sugar transferase involved in LPS biosynthesis (colanic, teichoic acid) [Chitinophaga arvensicola]
MWYRKLFKPLFDCLIALSAFILLLPFFLVITLLLTITNGGKPFFTQRRPGLNGRVFRLIKFKTMNDKRAADGSLLRDEERMTKVGGLVRKTSLDEIPQLLNVIMGDMSLVGPRPLLVEYLHLYNNEQHRRHEARPGITGWAQVNGRNAISWEKKFALDVWYVDHMNLLLDIRIMWMTFIKVFRSEGINQAGHVTMEKFTGSPKY